MLHREHTHLAYALELPATPGDVQRALNVVPEGSYIVAVKNPEAPSPEGVGLDETRRARLPKALAARFRGRRFIPVDPPEFLDYEGVEIVLVGAGRNVAEALGIDLEPAHETAATAEIFRDLTEAEKQGIAAAYYTSVEFLDENVGLVLNALKASGRADPSARPGGSSQIVGPARPGLSGPGRPVDIPDSGVRS